MGRNDRSLHATLLILPRLEGRDLDIGTRRVYFGGKVKVKSLAISVTIDLES
jgi:hypothetical protein